jgi:ribosomal protein S18 acetylase RimI-like enzyme
MDLHVVFTDDPAAALTQSKKFLASDAILHNLILTILHARIAMAEAGRYWIAKQGESVVGMAVQSPLVFSATLTPMSRQVVVALVNAIAEQGITLPGVNGDAATAAAFAGQWNERCKSSVAPFQANRIYELRERLEAPRVAGRLRQAAVSDRDLLLKWAVAFSVDIGEPSFGTESRVGQWLDSKQMWLWEDEERVSMAVGHSAVEGVVRISSVYTPPDKRGRGYASACVHTLSEQLRKQGYRCMLYTDLGNATSNSIYRKIGYRPVAEALRFRFG